MCLVFLWASSFNLLKSFVALSSDVDNENVRTGLLCFCKAPLDLHPRRRESELICKVLCLESFSTEVTGRSLTQGERIRYERRWTAFRGRRSEGFHATSSDGELPRHCITLFVVASMPESLANVDGDNRTVRCQYIYFHSLGQSVPRQHPDRSETREEECACPLPVFISIELIARGRDARRGAPVAGERHRISYSRQNVMGQETKFDVLHGDNGGPQIDCGSTSDPLSFV